jgi:hypothetical protein
MEFEKIPSLLAVATFSALSLTVAHEWGYFGIIGTDFQSLFTTYDYLSELLVAIGPAFVALAVLLAIHVAAMRADNFKAVGRSTAKSKWVRFISDWFWEIFYSIMFVLVLLFSDETTRFYVYLVVGLIWTRAIGYVYGHDHFAKFKMTPVGLLLLGLPAFMLCAYGLGRDGAYRDLKQTAAQYRLHLKSRAASQSVILLRLLDKGLVVLDPVSKAVAFQPKEDIKLIERDAPTWETRSLVCRHYGWSCPKH